jgi:flagellar motor switch protein FliN/FliY
MNNKGEYELSAEITDKLQEFSYKIEDKYFDLEINIDCKIGNAFITLEELLNLKVGDVVELDKSTGDGADIFSNNRIIARAEIMLFDKYFALRVNEAASYSTVFKYFQDEYK